METKGAKQAGKQQRAKQQAKKIPAYAGSSYSNSSISTGLLGGCPVKTKRYIYMVDTSRNQGGVNYQKTISAAAVTAAAHGQWREILTANGIKLPEPKKHGPCPICGGKDRFRLEERKAEKAARGVWVCSHCDCKGGDGLSLYQQATGQSMSEAIRSLASYLGLSGSMSAADHARIEKQRQKAAKAAEQQRAKEASQREGAADGAGGRWLHG